MWRRWKKTKPPNRCDCVAFDPDGETRVLEAIVFGNSTVSHDEAGSAWP